MAMMNFSSHGTQDMYPTFMKQFRGLDAKAYSQVVIVMMSGAILGGIAFGLASDRFGRQTDDDRGPAGRIWRWRRCGPSRRAWG